MTNSTTRIALTHALALHGGVASAQDGTASDFNDLTLPDMSAPEAEREYDVCPDREPRPQWVDRLNVHDSYKGVLLMRIYEARSFETIVASGDCSCTNRAPPWDAADAEYQANFALLDPQAQQRATGEFQTLRGSLRREAKAICEAQGNW